MAISFDETDDYYSIPDTADLTLQDGEWCVGIWTYLTDDTGSLYQYLLSNNGYSANNSFNLHLYEASTGAQAGQWQNILEDGDGTSKELTSTEKPGADSTWRLIINQRTSTQLELWFCEPDGEASLEDTATLTNFGAINGGNWNIGRRTDGNADRYYGGTACEFFVLDDSSLSESEIEELAAGKTAKALAESDLSFYLPMQEADATLTDEINSNVATRHSSPTSVEHAPITHEQEAAGTLTSAGGVVKKTSKPLAGTLTSAGAIIKATSKSLTSTLTSAGVVVKETGKVLSGTLTSSGTVVKETSKVLAGTLTSAGAVSTLKKYVLALAGTLTSAGTLTKETSKSLAGTLTSAGGVVKKTSKALAGTLTSAGSVVKQVSKPLAGTLTSAGAVAKGVSKALSGTLTSAGGVVKGTSKSLAGALALAGTLSKSATGAMAGIVALTLRSRSVALTLIERATGLTLRSRQSGLTLDDR